ncbi:MAG: hypothetical protein BGO55_21745 [Sphingobacteriales bacterium 50-39]|nr:chromate efflux transporter [Sphingobacteriales bacterium]OJW59607.1 MAG: hypothetical protein BGO55_21745 [Sphingobacteriales bacterium 50-39]
MLSNFNKAAPPAQDQPILLVQNGPIPSFVQDKPIPLFPATAATGDTTVNPGVGYLFCTCLKIGMVSFGGHMALVAMVQKIMADKDKRVSHETILEGISLAGLLPGPLAVNVVAHIGYRAKGIAGALASVLGVLLPAFTAMLFLSWLYVDYGSRQLIPNVWSHITGAVCAIILSTGVRLFQKEIKGSNPLNYILCVLTAGVMLFVTNYYITLGAILAGVTAGIFLSPAPLHKPEQSPLHNPGQSALQEPGSPLGWGMLLRLSLLSGLVLQFLADVQRYADSMLLRLAAVFSGISLTLFGGGYVMIPLMQSMLVDHLHWLTLREFVDGIAFSQATPGPILVSATFAGYRLAGAMGAVLATLCIFLPSVLLMICMSRILLIYKGHTLLKKIMAGVKPIVIGMILATGIRLPVQSGAGVWVWLVALISFILLCRYRINPVLIIMGTVGIDLLYYVLK